MNHFDKSSFVKEGIIRIDLDTKRKTQVIKTEKLR